MTGVKFQGEEAEQMIGQVTMLLSRDLKRDGRLVVPESAMMAINERLVDLSFGMGEDQARNMASSIRRLDTMEEYKNLHPPASAEFYVARQMGGDLTASQRRVFVSEFLSGFQHAVDQMHDERPDDEPEDDEDYFDEW